MELRPLRVEDAAAAARLHAALIGDSVFARLGEPFLELLYRGIVLSPHGWGIAAIGNEGLEGFIAVSTDTGKLYREILRRQFLSLGVVTAKALWRNPSLLRELVETPLYERRAGAGMPSELLFIAVDPAARRGGTGDRLVALALERLGAEGVRRVRATTVEGHEAAAALLEKHGFRKEGSFRFYGIERRLFTGETR